RDHVAQLDLAALAVDVDRQRQPEEPVLVAHRRERLARAVAPALLVALQPRPLVSHRRRIGDEREAQDVGVLEQRRNARRGGVGASSTSRFGKASSAPIARPSSGSSRNVARTAIEWPTITGTRTHVGVTASSGSARILRDSFWSFISSSV